MSQVELCLLARMRAADRVTAAVAQLGVDGPHFERARRSCWANDATFVLDDYRLAFGDELGVEPERNIDPGGLYAGSRRYRFAPALWRGFDLLVREHPDGYTWGPEFVRAADTPMPPAERIVDLAPWSVTESEVTAQFGPPVSEAAWEFGTDNVHREGDVELTLEFDFGLLQAVVA